MSQFIRLQTKADKFLEISYAKNTTVVGNRDLDSVGNFFNLKQT